jgi:hypothetical protein
LERAENAANANMHVCYGLGNGTRALSRRIFDRCLRVANHWERERQNNEVS